MKYTSKTLRWGALFLVLAAAGTARADSFPAGSMIIPMDSCYQYAGVAQPIRQGWNQGLPWATDYSTSTACVELTTTSTPNTSVAPYYSSCYAGLGYPYSPTGLQHAFGLLYLLAKNNVPVAVALRGDKEAVGDEDFGVPSPDGSTNAAFFMKWNGGGFTSGELGGSATSTAGATIYYRGGPLIIDAANVQKALSVMQTFHTANPIISDVLMHIARAPFQVPVAGVVQTTPKPVGLVSYSNSNGFNIGVKYLTDAGIIAVMGATSAYSRIALKVTGSGTVQGINYSWSGAPAATCSGGNCTTLTSTSTGQRVLDLVWAPDINLGTCQNLLPNPTCFDANGTCLPDSCLGANAWCCPSAGATIANQFNYDNLDGTSTTYYCPCGLAGGGNSNDTCSVDNYQYNPTNSASPTSECVTPNVTGGQPTTGCGGTTYICHATSQHCLQNCALTTCPTGYSCTTVSDVTGAACGGGTKCPEGYTCTAGTCQAKLCIMNTATTCSPACASDEYCDVTAAPDCSTGTPSCAAGTATCVGGAVSPTCSGSTPTCSTGQPACANCRAKWGCSLTCSNCPSSQKNTNVWSSLKTRAGGLDAFLVGGGRLLGTDSTALTAEGTSTHWLTTGGMSGTSGAINGSLTSSFCAAAMNNSVSGGPAKPLGSYPASDVFLQIGDFIYKALGGNSPSYYVAGTSNFIAGVHGIGIQQGTQWNYPVVKGQPLSGPCVDPTTCGTIIYEGANNYGSSAASAPIGKVAGQHIVFDSLLNANGNPAGVAPNPITPVELTRSAPIGGPLGQFYAGTFDWGYTSDSAGSGNNGYSPPPGTWPYATGHLREYKSVLDYQTGTDVTYTLGGTCSRTTPGNPCNWDAATWVGDTTKTRNIFVPLAGGTTYSLEPFTSANASNVAKVMFNTATPTPQQVTSATAVIAIVNNHKLGGIDYSQIAEVQESKSLVRQPTTPPNDPTSRPTILYVGARDGMLHAFCAHDKGGSQASPGLCYGYDPGAELWAIIPPAILRAMGAAYLASPTQPDFSGINVGGVMRVADANDAFPVGQPKSWRTILVYGTRNGGGGAVGALDISAPSLANKDRAGFQFLWEKTSSDYPMLGPTMGASIAQPSQTSFALVTAAKTGPAGIYTALLRLSDGSKVADTYRTYTRTMPSGLNMVIPSEVPALPSILDLDGDSFDDTALVPDLEGIVTKLTVNSGSLGVPLTLFDATTSYRSSNPGGCPTGTACQPIGAELAILRRAAGTPTFLALAVTGGADWASTGALTDYRVYGFDPGAFTTQTTPFLTLAPGTAITPLGTVPMRIYAPATVAGSDVFISASGIAQNTLSQLTLPYQHPAGVGQKWGEAMRFALGDSPAFGLFEGEVSATHVYNANNFSGGVGSALYTEATNSSGSTSATVTILGGQGGERHILNGALDTTSVRKAALSVRQGPMRAYKVMAWFGLD
jgi:hypothetical protein